MDWPIMVDALNLLEVAAVPITLFIDEFGIVRMINPRPSDLAGFLETTYAPPDPLPPSTELGAVEPAKEPGEPTPGGWSAFGDELFLWGGEERLDDAIDAYATASSLAPTNAPIQFRLGVAYRARYDSDRAQAGDFAKAVEHWGRALDLNANQYIWRRRIQQYGPRLDKPYSFYDWVHEARRAIEARGETPRNLSVEPRGAELAYPSRVFETGTEQRPDPRNQIERDSGKWIRIEKAVVPAFSRPGEPVRVHVMLRPDPGGTGHWNNEGDPTVLWVDLPTGWQADHQRLTIPAPPEPVSDETRTFEFEVRSPGDTAPGEFELDTFVLYGVCEDENGTCLYRRQDTTLRIRLRGLSP
jgi:hypothetical protein